MIHFDLSKIKEELKQLENETVKDGFWNNSKNSSIVLQQLKSLKGKFNKFNNIKSETDNLLELNDLLLIDLDEEMASMLIKSTNL